MQRSSPLISVEEEKTPATSKILVLSYDIDGCLFHAAKKWKDRSLWDKLVNAPYKFAKWLITTNQKLLDHDVDLIKKMGYQKVIIQLNTSRQSPDIDNLNSNPCGSCMPVPAILQRYFSNHLPDCEVVFDPILTSDIFTKLEAGTSYKMQLQALYGKKDHSPTKLPFTLFDNSKKLLTYVHMHRVASFHPNAKIDFLFRDDREDIVTGVYDWLFGKTLIPKNVTFTAHQYGEEGLNKKCLHSYCPDVRSGTGEIDTHYEWGARYMAATVSSQRHHGSEKINRNIDTAQALKDFQNKIDRDFCEQGEIIMDYYPPRYKLEDFGSNAKWYENFQLQMQANDGPKPTKSFNSNAFITFREKEIPKLANDSTLGNKPNYYTADMLLQDHLLPEKFLEFLPKPGVEKETGCSFRLSKETSMTS